MKAPLRTTSLAMDWRGIHAEAKRAASERCVCYVQRNSWLEPVVLHRRLWFRVSSRAVKSAPRCTKGDIEETLGLAVLFASFGTWVKGEWEPWLGFWVAAGPSWRRRRRGQRSRPPPRRRPAKRPPASSSRSPSPGPWKSSSVPQRSRVPGPSKRYGITSSSTSFRS